MKKLIVCLFGMAFAFGAHTYARELLIGDYVTMGKYSEAPIVWRCVDINENGALMLSDRIITCKAFDAAGEHVNDAFGYRKSGGGGTWSTSALRKWLNSAEETVDYGINLPVAEKVTDNAYSGEQGFLSGFSQMEQELLNSAVLTSIINGCDVAAASGGTQEHIFKTDNAVQNYSDSYVQTTTDKVFLPGVRELQKSGKTEVSWGRCMSAHIPRRQRYQPRSGLSES